MKSKQKTAAIMIQGNTSDAGKSVIAAAICRILTRRGFSVAPFKAQNMSNNAAVTPEGGEIGRAQAVQALACNLAPDVRMNPLLLKPSSTLGCQVVLLGKPMGNMNVHKYHSARKDLFEQVKAAYDSLAEEVDIVVIEGAGSPAEINLMAHDIANMKMAQHAQAAVFIVGDIDRGGVYAHFIGTYSCLFDQDKDLVKGFIVNKFRGDSSLLTEAHDEILRRIGVPVIGVVPAIESIAIPEEDSFAFKNDFCGWEAKRRDAITVALIYLPHMANLNDFEPFAGEPDIRMLLADSPDQIGGADLVIIPGSKNVISDMEFLRERGFVEALQRYSQRDTTTILGICGGFQMLGSKIADPFCVESTGETVKGTSLLNVNTKLEQCKTTTLVRAHHTAWNAPLHGYEIHHGVTDVESLNPLAESDSGAVLWKSSSQKIYGTYLHGLFDSDIFRRRWIDEIRLQKGLEPLREVLFRYDVDAALDRLTDVVEQSIDIELILKSAGLK